MTVTAITPDSAGGMTGAVSGCSDAARGYIQILMAATLFGLSGSVAKVVLDGGVEPARLTALRCTGAAFGLLVVLATTNPALLRVARRDLPILIVMSLCGATLIQWLYFVAIDRLPVGVALLLEFTAPLLVALYSRFVLRHAVDRRVWLALALALGGLALVAEVWGGGGLDPIGVGAALAAAGCLAAFWLVGKQALGRIHALSITFWIFAFSSVFWAVAQPWWTFDASVLTQRASMLGALDTVSVPLWVPIVWVIVLGTLAPYALELVSLRHLTPTATGVVGMSEPVIAAAIAWVWLGQSLGTVQVVGAAVVLVGVIIVQTVTTTDSSHGTRAAVALD